MPQELVQLLSGESAAAGQRYRLEFNAQYCIGINQIAAYAVPASDSGLNPTGNRKRSAQLNNAVSSSAAYS